MQKRRYFSTGNNVIAWSNERYGVSKLTVCVVEEVEGDELLLYAIEENRSFFRNRLDVMSFEELKEDFERVSEDMKLYKEDDESEEYI